MDAEAARQISSSPHERIGGVERYFRFFYDPSPDDADHWDCRRRAKVLVITCHLGTLLIVIAITARVVSGTLPSLGYAGVVAIAGLAFLVAPFMLRRTLSVSRAALLPIVAVTLVLPVMLFQSGGLDAPTVAILPALPVIVAFFAGFRVAGGFALVLAVEIVALAASSRLGWVHPYAAPVSLKAILVIAYVAVTTAIAFVYERERLDVERRHRQLADVLYDNGIRDPLTKLYNRRFFAERLANEVAFTQRHGGPLALLALDIDHFKRINDDFGHAAGDVVLTSIAGVLQQSIREEDIVARYGGEEFVILLRGADLLGARAAAERLRLAVANRVFTFAAGRVSVTTSIGIACATGGLANGDDLVSRADEHMYRAKRSGRNRIVTDCDPDNCRRSERGLKDLQQVEMTAVRRTAD